MIDLDIQVGTKAYVCCLGQWVEIKEIEDRCRCYFKAITADGYIGLFQSAYIKKFTNRDYTLDYLNNEEL